MNSTPLLQVEHLAKRYRTGATELVLFSDLNLALARGEMAAIIGQSGAGKSTLLHILAALDTPTSGAVFFDGQPLATINADMYRNREIGYVWQFHYLLPEFTALENAAMPLLARGTAHKDALAQAAHWLKRVGLADRATHRSGELSGGEQQRVSLARALITQPKLLLADELTGDLDDATGAAIFDLLSELHAENGLTTLLVTHNHQFAARCNTVFRLQSGALAPFPHNQL